MGNNMLNDLISRQAAIDAINRLDIPEDMCVFEILSHIELELETLPSAQPERKKGKWIYDGDCYICDQCKSAFGWWADSQTSNYCPNCGADMRGE